MAGPATRGLAVVLSALALGACTSHRDSPHAQTGVPDSLVKDSAQFQRPGGLFVAPETADREDARSALRATAQYLEVLDRPALHVLAWDRAAVVPLPDAPDIVDADAFLRVRRAAGAPVAPADLGVLTAALAVPPVQQDPGAEIGALWTWTDARELLTAAGGRLPVPPEVPSRAAAVDPAVLRTSPYLVRRLEQVDARLGLAPPPALRQLADAVPATPLPRPTSVVAALDASAVVAERAARHMDAGVDDAYARQVGAVLTGSADVEDLSRAALLGLLVTAGREPAARGPLDALRARVSPSSGLLTGADASTGDVETTYQFARLLDRRFQEVASAATLRALRAAVGDASRPLASRLRADAALRAAEDTSWQQLSVPLLAQLPARPASVGLEELGGYLDVMEPAVRLAPDLPKSALREFAVTADATTQRAAVAAVTSAYLFSDDQAVAAMFPAFQHTLRGWLDAPDTPLPQLLAAASTLPASRAVTLDPATLQRVGKRVSDRLGCRRATSFLPVDGSRTGTCSVVLTLQARGVPEIGWP